MLKIFVQGSNLPSVLAFSPLWKFHKSIGHGKLRNATVYSPLSFAVEKAGPIFSNFVCLSISGEDKDNDEYVKDLRIPDEWMTPSTALQILYTPHHFQGTKLVIPRCYQIIFTVLFYTFFTIYWHCRLVNSLVL